MIISNDQIQAFKDLDEEYQTLQDQRADLFDELFKPGTTVYWWHQGNHEGHIQHGTVISCRNYNDFLDMRVENSKTGRVVSVTLFDISWPHMKAQADELEKLVKDLDQVLQEEKPADE